MTLTSALVALLIGIIVGLALTALIEVTAHLRHKYAMYKINKTIKHLKQEYLKQEYLKHG